MRLADELSGFRHTIDIRVRFDDLDPLGHVNNKSYLAYLEDSRIDYYRVVLAFDLHALRFGSVVRRIEIDYVRPVHIADRVRVYLRCVRIGRKSADFESVITRTGESGPESMAARSVATLVAIDSERGVSRVWDEEYVRAIDAYERIPPRRATAEHRTAGR